jgi:hypothetical protein
MQPLSYVRDYLGNFLGHFFIPSSHNAHRPRILHRPWLIFFLAVILATEGFLVSNLIARQSDQQFLAAVVPAEIISLTNTERADNSVGNLKEDALLDSAAQAKANDMAQSGYFAHVGPDGKTPWQWISASGYQYQYAGENLAVRFIDSSDVVNAWMASPTHRANMVKPVYTQIGVGVAEGIYQGQPATYVVQYFGTPKDITQRAPVVPAATNPTNTAPVAAAAALATPSSPAVEGASTQAPQIDAAQSNSFTQTIAKQLIRAFSNPKQSSNLLLGFIAVLLVGALLFTFFIHLQIQHTNLLVAGAFVAAVALFFFAVNTLLVGVPNSSQSASVATAQSGVIITQDAADTGYALFPN